MTTTNDDGPLRPVTNIQTFTLDELVIPRRSTTRADGMAARTGVTLPKAAGARLEYQRDATPVAKKIAERFDPALWQRPTVIRQKNGKVVVVDGGNRITGLRLRGLPGTTLVECEVLNAMPGADEVRYFLAINTSRKSVDALTIFQNEALIGDTPAGLITSALEAVGIKVSEASGRSVKATAALRKSYSVLVGPDATSPRVCSYDVFARIIAAAYDATNVEPGRVLTAPWLNGVFTFLAEGEGWSESGVVRMFQRPKNDVYTLNQIANMRLAKLAADTGVPIRSTQHEAGGAVSPFIARLLMEQYDKANPRAPLSGYAAG